MAAVMLQGTGSDVGKSVLVAGLCRLFTDRGLRVRPFKPQNMSNNAAVTADGGEIGRAQALQARACRTAPMSAMNPVLIKPQSDTGAQIVVNGRVAGTLGAGDYQARKGELLNVVLAAYEDLRREADLVLVEGAGSPAEINLRGGDIANMGFARAAGVPVVMVGDIDRGGVIASLVGTRAVLDTEDARMIQGFLINKFRGDPALFEDGYRAIERLTGWPGLGVVPWLAAARRLPAEDAVVLDQATRGQGAVTIAVPILPRIANFDDLDPLAQEPGVKLVMTPPGQPLPSDADLIILPGTKATLADLDFLRAEGWDIDIKAHVRRGGRVLGLCGGYQMLGRSIADPDGIEGPARTVAGLGLLPVDTALTPDKQLKQVSGLSLPEGTHFTGYEIHCGRTTAARGAEPLLCLSDGAMDGVVGQNGRVFGTYVHGLFDHPQQRALWLARLGASSDGVDQAARVDAALDALSESLSRCIDTDALLAMARSAP